jgi:choline dehydrogenase
MEVVLSLGTVNTPKVLMLSGIGDEAELKGLGIPVHQNLRGVGQNFQDHLALYSVWQDQIPLPIRNNGSGVSRCAARSEMLLRCGRSSAAR